MPHRGRSASALSHSSPAQLGGREDDFEQDLRAALLTSTSSGRFDEVIRTEAIVATGPKPSGTPSP
ncbi:hypothetical protein [Streptomyces sp. NPDC003247]|uniref:hypothetical protein n=1 Tax=Streptomyces sp. NPDC003247 TaxID=3364677 RepID=UPI0036997B32